MACETIFGFYVTVAVRLYVRLFILFVIYS
jgi:hypothetical protein